LILEEGTPFFEAKESLSLPNEDVECDMYYLACERLADVNYSHYEISNYAKDGFTCKHNLKYWHDEEYIGVGLAAHSYFNGRRFANTENINDYLSRNFANYAKGEIIDDETLAYEYVMLSLRLAEGFSLSDYNERFGVDFRLGREDTLKMLMDNDLLIINGDRLSLTEKGMYVSNNILSDLI
jgi:oxygen-independent coproporphyrinogen-3 oxidase